MGSCLLLTTLDNKKSNRDRVTYKANLNVIMLRKQTRARINEFEPRLKSSKNQFQLSAGLNLKTL